MIWVQHQSGELPEGSEQWQYVPELKMDDGEPVVHKRYGDSFEDTTLESELAARSVGRLIVTGAQTDACVRSTLHGAFTRGYDTTLVSDAHTTEDLTQWGAPPVDAVIAHTNLYWSFQTAPDRTAAVARAGGAEVVERRDRDRRGKGYALAFGVDALRAGPPAVVKSHCGNHE